MPIVYHAPDTTDNRFVWIDYWREHSGKEVPNVCPCCTETPVEPNEFVGAHVMRLEEYCLPEDKQHVFITPTCKGCNDKYKNCHNLDRTFFVADELLVDIMNL